MKYSELGFKINTDYNTVNIKDHQIKVLKYLSAKDKNDLVEIALQKSLENGIYNEIKLDIYFHMYIILMYTDLEFTDEEKMNLETVYDELESNDIIVEILAAMEENEYQNLKNMLRVMLNRNETFMRSTTSLLQTFIQDMPKNAEAVREIVDNFDKEKYKEVVEFAQAANGGRPI